MVRLPQGRNWIPRIEANSSPWLEFVVSLVWPHLFHSLRTHLPGGVVASLLSHNSGVKGVFVYSRADTSSNSVRLFNLRAIFSQYLRFLIPNSWEGIRLAHPDLWLGHKRTTGLTAVAEVCWITGPNMMAPNRQLKKYLLYQAFELCIK